MKARSDQELQNLLTEELQRRLPESAHQNDETLVAAIRKLPTGLRAMAAIHPLDVSMTLDDVIWHFFNHHNHDLAQESINGLRLLEAKEAADLFERAYKLVCPHWEDIEIQRRKDASGWGTWIEKSGIKEYAEPLNRRLWAICAELGHNGLMKFWINFARKYSHRVLEE